MPHSILILEDDADRIARFLAALKTIDIALEPHVWRTAPSMLREVEAFLPNARLISLDHDLYSAEGDTDDPGDGVQVAEFLANQHATCPILIHSSNVDRARMMEGILVAEGCNARQVAPLGADWIEAYWARIVQSLLHFER